MEKEKIIINTMTSIEIQINNGGISKLVEYLFNWSNVDNEIPAYSYFIEAFERFQKQKDKEGYVYSLQVVGPTIHFKMGEETYIMNTSEGKILELKYLIEDKAYDEIFMTDVTIWSAIYLDGGRIYKEEFIPIMYRLWEYYWEDCYEELKKNIGNTEHMNKIKEKSWKQFQIFSASYNDVSDIIKYAWKLSDMILYPIVVVTMLEIFHAEICIEEYCGFEFNTKKWTMIWVGDEDEDDLVFYVKKREL